MQPSLTGQPGHRHFELSGLFVQARGSTGQPDRPDTSCAVPAPEGTQGQMACGNCAACMRRSTLNFEPADSNSALPALVSRVHSVKCDEPGNSPWAWRRVCVAAGAFPVNLSGFRRGQATPVVREDARLWAKVVEKRDGPQPDFGDFGVTYPECRPRAVGPRTPTCATPQRRTGRSSCIRGFGKATMTSSRSARTLSIRLTGLSRNCHVLGRRLPSGVRPTPASEGGRRH